MTKEKESSSGNLFCFIEKEKLDAATKENSEIVSILLAILMSLEDMSRDIKRDKPDHEEIATDIRKLIVFFGTELKKVTCHRAFESLAEGPEE